jgi:hypothetical protein
VWNIIYSFAGNSGTSVPFNQGGAGSIPVSNDKLFVVWKFNLEV